MNIFIVRFAKVGSLVALLLLIRSTAVCQPVETSESETWAAIKALMIPVGETPQAKSESFQNNAQKIADMSRGFYTQFPNGEHAFDARILEAEKLGFLSYRSGSPEIKARYAEAMKALSIMPDLAQGQRVRIRSLEMDRDLVAGLSFPERTLRKGRSLIAEFPTEREGYVQLLLATNRLAPAEAVSVAQEVLGNNAAPEFARNMARGVLTKHEATGKPFELKFTSLDGKSVDLADFKGKPVLLVCWASWCKPCLAEVPDLKQLYEKWHDKGLEFIGLSGDTDRAAMEAAVAANQIPWPQAYDPAGTRGDVFRRLGVVGIPALFLVGPDGKLTGLQLDSANLVRAVDSYMNLLVGQ